MIILTLVIVLLALIVNNITDCKVGFMRHMTVQDKIELMTKIIIGCKNQHQMDVCRRWVRVTAFWHADQTMYRTVHKLMYYGDYDLEYFKADPNIDHGECYECDKYINRIIESRLQATVSH